ILADALHPALACARRYKGSSQCRPRTHMFCRSLPATIKTHNDQMKSFSSYSQILLKKIPFIFWLPFPFGNNVTECLIFLARLLQ
ncbi:MAG: hypothetical protein P1U70_27125, partial [Saprospiraceae bacterium]|nr:hypothetical protein [Saprospiraceae bacterium]